MSGALAPMQVFRDIAVWPTQAFRMQRATGGPDWPDFAGQVAVRHCRNGAAVDFAPVPSVGALERIGRPCVWGGVLVLAFGHLVAERLTRLLVSLRERPDDLYLFTTQPGWSEANLRGYVWDLLEWYGLPRAQVRVLNAAVQVDELRVAPQAEMLGNVGPSAAYLDLLAAHTAARGLVAEPVARLYVSRSGMVAEGLGGHAGEAHLVAVLERLGVRVMDPRRVPLAGQLALYAGAGAVVFAEGSALHGRQILGRLDQDIHVLQRRRGRHVAQGILRPRCRTIAYHAVVGESLMAFSPRGKRRPDHAMAIYDKAALFQAFAVLGVDLATAWDEDAYRTAAIADIEGWIASRKPRAEALAEHRNTLNRAGLLPPGLALSPPKSLSLSGPAPHFEG